MGRVKEVLLGDIANPYDPNCEQYSDNVNSPPHYKDRYPFEVIELIEQMLTPEQFVGYCLGNELKYRLRAGVKSPTTVVEDIKKSEWYHERRVRFNYDR